MIKWQKADGQKVETNGLPASIKAAEGLGWKRVKAAAKPKLVKARAK